MHAPLLIVTEYVVVVAGETVMLCVVDPVLQEYVEPTLAVSVVLLPEQIELFPVIAAITG